MADTLIAQGRTVRLNEQTYPNCLLHRSDPNDVARTEKVTFICTQRQGRRRPDESLDGSRRSQRKNGALVCGVR